MYRNILIALDGSEAAPRALDAGADLARRCGARLALLHVVTPPVPLEPVMMPACAEAEEDLLAEGRDRLALLAARAPAGVEVEQVVAAGRPAERIVAEARRRRADLVVVGDHNRGALSRFLLGSTADAVVRHAPCPVLVVRQRRDGATDPRPGGEGEEQDETRSTPCQPIDPSSTSAPKRR